MAALIAFIGSGSRSCWSQDGEQVPFATQRFAYEVQLEQAAVPITKNYLDALTRLQSKYSSSGELDGTLAVRAEIDRVKAGGDPKPNLAVEKRVNPS